MTVIRTLSTVTLLLMAGLAAAEDTSGPPPYAYFVQTEIESDHAGAWARAVTIAAEAHAGHEHGRTWAAYRKLTGGPDHSVRFFFGLSELGELDRWKSNREILIDALGAAEGRRVHLDLELGTQSTDRIIAYHEASSHPWTTAPPDPPRYMWVVTVKVDDGKLIEYAALHKRVKGAYASNTNSPNWLVYGNAIGGDRSEHVFYFPFVALAEGAAGRGGDDALTRAYGGEDSARLSAAIEAITETTTSLWRLEPSLSQLAKE